MEFYKDNQIIEYVRFNIGTRMRLFEENGALVYKNRDYVWKLGKFMIPIPSWLFVGDATIQERSISPTAIEMDFIMRHPWFGMMFRYRGHFEVKPSDAIT